MTQSFLLDIERTTRKYETYESHSQHFNIGQFTLIFERIPTKSHCNFVAIFYIQYVIKLSQLQNSYTVAVYSDVGYFLEMQGSQNVYLTIENQGENIPGCSYEKKSYCVGALSLRVCSCSVTWLFVTLQLSLLIIQYYTQYLKSELCFIYGTSMNLHCELTLHLSAF